MTSRPAQPRQRAVRTRLPVRSAPRKAAAKAGRRPWTTSQERLALLYNEQGLRPDEIAQKLRLSRYLVTQIILGARSQGKL